MPKLTVRAMAELLNLPGYEQVRILHAQKYPKKEPQIFRAPFYSPALSAIRRYYQSNNDSLIIKDARVKISQLGAESRRDHNFRVLDQFEKDALSKRNLTLQPLPNLKAMLGQVELRLSTDMYVLEKDENRYIYLNCRNTQLDEKVAHITLDIAHWVLEQNGIEQSIKAIEFTDLQTGRIYQHSRRRENTLRALHSNIKIIETLWPFI